jgi:hypothetical protein
MTVHKASPISHFEKCWSQNDDQKKFSTCAFKTSRRAFVNVFTIKTQSVVDVYSEIAASCFEKNEN